MAESWGMPVIREKPTPNHIDASRLVQGYHAPFETLVQLVLGVF